MKNYKKLYSRGFSHHFLLPVLAVIVVGAIGVYTMSMSSAATSGCKESVLATGSKGTCVKNAERMLNATHGTGSDVKVDTKYTSLTAKKTARFQKKQKLAVDGKIGQQTWDKLCQLSYSGRAATAKRKACSATTKATPPIKTTPTTTASTTATTTATAATNEDTSTTASVNASSTTNQPTTTPSGASVTFSKLKNFRDTAGSSGTIKAGVLYRSARLYEASASDITSLSNLMSGGLIIDLRETSAQKSYPDKAVPGVSRVSYPMTSTTDYTKFVTGSSDRTAIKNTITDIATSPGKVLIHCTLGRDRTGWITALVMYTLGANDSQVMTEYLKTSSTSSSTLNKGLAKARSQYGSIDNYLKTGIGLSDSTLASLKAKLKP